MDDLKSYNDMVEYMRSAEYPMLKNNIYLDHAGTTMYAKSLLEVFSHEMISGLYGNPHSASPSSQSSTRQVESARIAALGLFNADPKHFDLVFTANATAGIKLVQEAFMTHTAGFWYGYHVDSHTSLVGVREGATAGSLCFRSDEEIEDYLAGSRLHRAKSTESPEIDTQSHDFSCFDACASVSGSLNSFTPPDSRSHKYSTSSESLPHSSPLQLLAYGAQSNMNGRRLPLSWPRRIRSIDLSGTGSTHYSMLDASALVSTAPLDLSDAAEAPDFTVLSFYKMFGFPDLGALIVRREAADVLRQRRYFGGGTVDMVTCLSGKHNWHMAKSSSLHAALEDGTLPIHSIMALSIAIQTHEKLFGSFADISSHTANLVRHLYNEMSNMIHSNGEVLCKIHAAPGADYNESKHQGPIIAFNLMDSRGAWISNAEVERLASIYCIHLRSGGLCNPGGVARSLGLSHQDSERMYAAGYRCGGEIDIVERKPTGVLRISLGAMSTLSDIEAFLDFLKSFFLEITTASPNALHEHVNVANQRYIVDAIVIYPIKSCGGWSVPRDVHHNILQRGFEWDRSWCVIQTGTEEMLSQKKFPRMALIKPRIDLEHDLLHLSYKGPPSTSLDQMSDIHVPLRSATLPDQRKNQDDVVGNDTYCTQVCGLEMTTQACSSTTINNFFSAILGMKCHLARSQPMSFTAMPVASASAGSHRRSAPIHAKSTDIKQRTVQAQAPGSLANESPILAITSSSLARLNADISAHRSTHGQGLDPISASAFRPNLILRPAKEASPQDLRYSYAEDHWQALQLLRVPDQNEERTLSVSFDVTGPCRRCQMVCIDQETGEKRKEPFITLSKTRRREGGGVYFGVGIGLTSQDDSQKRPSISVGDELIASTKPSSAKV